jgi:aspartyl-tRNA(Asn)/glutamyl-tRNA(Gln) amidotransferase subunit A
LTDPTDLTLTQILNSLRLAEISCQELTRAYLEKIDSLEPKIHAFLHLSSEQAIEAARQADLTWTEWRKNPEGPLPTLLGIPLAIKDVLCVAGMPCTCGSRILEGFVPAYSATAVERLRAAGAIILGKTNTDEFAMGSSTENSAYGVTHNPWDLERVPGGSSGGSAAAVAARLAPAALGTDTGGSVRHPASFCGVSALKPTYGRVSRYGLVAFGSSLDVVGAFGRTVEDVSLVYSVMAGHDARDATTQEFPVAPTRLILPAEKPLHGVRIGIPSEYFNAGLQPEVQSAVQQAIACLESLGGSLQAVSLPHTSYALPVYYLLAPAEASANLARYDGIRYGSRAPADTLWEVFRQTRGQKFGAEVKRRIMLGTYALSAGYYEAYYGQAQKVRTLIKRDFDLTFKQVDLIAAPVTPTTAFRIGEHANDPLAMYLEDILTLPANLAGIPALAFPVGFDQQGLPIGMQLMAPHFSEDRLLSAGHAYQQVTTWHLSSPEGLN